MAIDETLEEPFVPVPLTYLRSLQTEFESLQIAAKNTDASVRGFFELTEDYKRDAIRRLQERGASEAQIQSYEAAFHDQTHRVNEQMKKSNEKRESFGRLLNRLLS